MEQRRPGFVRATLAVTLGVPLSLDRPLPEGERTRTDWSNDPATLLEQRSACETIGAAVDALPARQRQVIREHYYGEWSLRDVGRRMRISPQRASQLHIAAVKKLRRSLHASPP